MNILDLSNFISPKHNGLDSISCSFLALSWAFTVLSAVSELIAEQVMSYPIDYGK